MSRRNYFQDPALFQPQVITGALVTRMNDDKVPLVGLTCGQTWDHQLV